MTRSCLTRRREVYYGEEIIFGEKITFGNKNQQHAEDRYNGDL
jgi:hypothetical protein